jgi:hypothetical protein
MLKARRAAGVVMSAALAGCALAPDVTAPRGPDFFPLHDGAYWFFDGIAGGEGARVGIRVVEGTTDREPVRVQIAWQAPGAAQADVMDLSAVWRGGFLVLQDKPYELRLLPERPKQQPPEWRWKSGADAFRPGGRFAGAVALALRPGGRAGPDRGRRGQEPAGARVGRPRRPA